MFVFRLKEEHVLLSADGPDRNVLKFKPPMCITTQDIDNVVDKLDKILSEIETDDSVVMVIASMAANVNTTAIPVDLPSGISTGGVTNSTTPMPVPVNSSQPQVAVA